jgi:DNA-directed RNA polymerase subunit M/transcription elongation factor TFIIS
MARPFNPKPKCPKCGSGDISLRYRLAVDADLDEMKHTCNTCEYFWFTDCADAADEVAALELESTQ